MIYSKIIETPIGNLLACAVEEGICSLGFTDRQYFERELKKLSKEVEAEITEQSCSTIDMAENQLTEYFNGKRKTFKVPLYLVGTDFQKKVWTHLLSIGYGKTTTYKEQAMSLGNVKAIRAVASANGANRIPVIIPCHRVVGSHGGLTGYGGGLWRKQFLLDIENNQYKINLL